jgi:spore maturation protein CgeB
MVEMGWCPSGRLFEAAACGVPIVSDRWEGLASFFKPGEEIILADDPIDVVAALSLSDQELQSIARRARQRTLDEHSSSNRAAELIRLLEGSTSGRREQFAKVEDPRCGELFPRPAAAAESSRLPFPKSFCRSEA